MLARLSLAAMWLLRLLPLAVLARTGEAFGLLLYALAGERRRVCLINLACCFPDRPADQRRALARRHFRVLARSILERGLLWWSRRGRIEALIRIEGREHIERELGRPLILLAPHFVGLDAAWSRLACDYDMASIYANQKSALFNRVMREGRLRFGNQRLYSRQEGVRGAATALREHRPLYYLPDMDYGPRDAIFVPFFGVPAATITALPRLAKLAGAKVLPCVAKMLPGGEGYALRCYPAWDNYPSDDIEADTRRMNAFIEERVREMPEQYFWTHKRFKTRPDGESKWY